jgi:hypothetical protein
MTTEIQEKRQNYNLISRCVFTALVIKVNDAIAIKP